MHIKDVDTTKVYAYREGSYGHASPVRVLDNAKAYQRAGNGRYIPAERRTRKSYRGTVLLGGYLAVTIAGAVRPEAMEALKTATLEDAQNGSLPLDLLKPMLLKTARWVMEEYEAYTAALDEEEKRRAAWKVTEDAMRRETFAAGSELREAMQACGFIFLAGGLRISSDRDTVLLTMQRDEARELTRLMRDWSTL